jgi:hypothetical protein
MGLINYILRKIIESGKYNIFNICPMYFLDNYPNKFEVVKKQIVDNDFFGEKQKKVYMEIFASSQRHYYAFGKLAKIWKYKKCTYYNIQTDLCMNNLAIFPASQKITLIHFNKKYIFRLTDLINIWVNALTKNICLSPHPRYPINPYINKPFKKHHLFLIYFKLLDSTISTPLLIQKFFKLEFNLSDFEYEMYTELKECSIENYINDSDDSTILFEIINMLESLRVQLEYVYIDTRLPRNCMKIVINTLKPFLKEYFYGKHSYNPLKKEICLSTSINGLKCFFSREPTFGTLIYFDISSTRISLEMDVEMDVETDVETDVEMDVETDLDTLLHTGVDEGVDEGFD